MEGKVLKYAIYPPKLEGSQVYYKDLIVLCLENEKVIGAIQYDYSGNSRPVSYIGLPYKHHLNTDFHSIGQVDMSLLSSPTRVTWSFETETEAFIQKVWCLKELRKKYGEQETNNRKEFDGKISNSIDTAFENIRLQNPEYFL